MPNSGLEKKLERGVFSARILSLRSRMTDRLFRVAPAWFGKLTNLRPE